MSKKVDTKNDKNQNDMEDFTKQLNMLEKETEAQTLPSSISIVNRSC